MAPRLPGRLLALAAALAAAGAARAGLPAPDAEAPSSVALLYDSPAPGATSLHWKLENRGGERALDVAVFAEPTWRKDIAAFSDPVSLDPGEAVEADFKLGPLPGPGDWFVPLRVAGWDPSGRPIRSWRCPRFSVPAPKASPPLAFSLAAAPETGVASRGPFEVRIELRSLSKEPVEARVRLLVPSGLSPADPPILRASLAPGGAFVTNVAPQETARASPADRPASPPYSSSRITRWVWEVRKSFSRLPMDRLAGAKTGSFMIFRISVSPSWVIL